MDLKSVLKSVAKPETVSNISQETGESEDTVQQIIKMGLPMILGKVGQNVSTNKGEASLNNALDQHSDTSILDTLGGLFGESGSTTTALQFSGRFLVNQTTRRQTMLRKRLALTAQPS